MSDDSKFGMQVGGVARTAPVRRVSGSPMAPNRSGSTAATPTESLSVARLIRLSADLSTQPAPVDTARVASLRAAIAEGRYAPEPAIIARAMVAYGQGSAD